MFQTFPQNKFLFPLNLAEILRARELCFGIVSALGEVSRHVMQMTILVGTAACEVVTWPLDSLESACTQTQPKTLPGIPLGPPEIAEISF